MKYNKTSPPTSGISNTHSILDQEMHIIRRCQALPSQFDNAARGSFEVEGLSLNCAFGMIFNPDQTSCKSPAMTLEFSVS